MYLIMKLITIITDEENNITNEEVTTIVEEETEDKQETEVTVEEEKIQEDKIEEEKVEIVEDNIVSAQNEEVEALADTDSLKAAIKLDADTTLFAVWEKVVIKDPIIDDNDGKTPVKPVTPPTAVSANVNFLGSLIALSGFVLFLTNRKRKVN